MLMLQEALVGVSFFKFVAKDNESSAITVFAYFSIHKFIAPIPYLENRLLTKKKSCVITIPARISSYLNFRLIIYHKHAPSHLFMYVIML